MKVHWYQPARSHVRRTHAHEAPWNPKFVNGNPSTDLIAVESTAYVFPALTLSWYLPEEYKHIWTQNLKA